MSFNGNTTTKTKTTLHQRQRNIEDIPFYKLHHGFDELPLDPLKPFITEQIRKSTLEITSLNFK